MQWGNTTYDISNNPTDQTVNLYALAARFRIVDLAASYVHDFSRYSVGVSSEAVRNIAYNLGVVESLSGQSFAAPQNKGYVAEVSFGDPSVDHFGRWRAAIGYRYVQADAVLDAWTDADFHGGGTNAAGYYLWTSLGLTNNTWLRLRYLSANEITGLRYAQDVVQFDVNAKF